MAQLDNAKSAQAGKVFDGNPAAPKHVIPVPLAGMSKNELPARAAALVKSGQTVHPLEKFYDVPLTMVFEVGRTEITIGQLMELDKGSFIDLWQVSVDSIDVRINEKIIAYGEAIALKQRYGVRLGELELLVGFEES